MGIKINSTYKSFRIVSNELILVAGTVIIAIWFQSALHISFLDAHYTFNYVFHIGLLHWNIHEFKDIPV